MKMLHLVFKVSSTCSRTRLKSLSPLSNCFINYALVKLVPFLSNPASLIPCVWLQAEDTLNTRCNIYHLSYFVSEFYDPTLWNRPTAVLFSGHWLFCWVQLYNACYVLHFVAAITSRHTKNIYEICNCRQHRLKANFLTNTVT